MTLPLDPDLSLLLPSTYFDRINSPKLGACLMSATETQPKFGQTSFSRIDPSYGISLNRRSLIPDTPETTGDTFVPDSAGSIVKEKCENALSLWPNAKAAILYGSRARGNHRADSDWDIAFITRTKESLPSEVLRELNVLGTRKKIYVHGLAIPQNEFYDNANSLGNVVASIAHEGTLIAGHCKWPDTERKLIIKPDVYKEYRAMALSNISIAVDGFVKGIRNARTGSDQTAFKNFVKGTADAAEFFAKIAFSKIASGTSKEYPYSHEVNDIVKEIDENIEHFDREKANWWRCDQGREFHDLLRAMNGYGREDHQYGYQILAPNDKVITRAASRLLATVKFAIREVKEVPGPECLRKVAIEIAEPHRSDLLELANRLRQILRDIDLNESTFLAAGPVLAKSAKVAVNFGGTIAQALEELANSLSEEENSEDIA